MRQSSDPTLKNIFDLFKQDIFSNLNCHAIGKIESFNATQQTANVSIDYKRQSSNDTNAVVNYPLLVDCPAIVVGGGNGSLRFPITAGDKCLIFFNDRDIDNWFSGSSNAVLNTERKHSFSDSIVLIGLHSLANPLSEYDVDKTELIHGDSKVSLGDDDAIIQYNGTKLTLASKAKLENSTASLYTILDGVLDVIIAFTSTPCAVGNPVNLSPAQVTQITTFKTQLGQLME